MNYETRFLRIGLIKNELGEHIIYLKMCIYRNTHVQYTYIYIYVCIKKKHILYLLA